MSNFYAQSIQDALRFSEDEIKGTARFRAMSGAFGALGGDMSAVSINPAGSAIFNRSHASITLSNEGVDNDISYFNGFSNSSNSEFGVNQTGAAFVFNNTNKNSNWRKFVLSFNYDQSSNFNDEWFAAGTNTRNVTDLSNSIVGFFNVNAQGVPLGDISLLDGENISDAYLDIGQAFGSESYRYQQAFLAYQSFILEPNEDTNENVTYTPNVTPGTFDQEFDYAATGYNGKFSFNLATQYQDNLYLGLNLNSHIINYDRITKFFEANDATGTVINEIFFENVLSTTGSGFSFQLGGIAKLSDQLRVGLTYNSPTWLTIAEETTQYLDTFSAAGIPQDDGSTFESAIVNPQVVNVFPDYKIQTPGKITGSAALLFDKKGLISFDYSRKDYGSTKFKPESDGFYSSQNDFISNNLKAANSYKIGGEYKHKQFSFRGGYRFEESPYNDTSIVGDLTGYSLGLGYNFGNTRLDLSFDQSERQTDYQFFDVGFTDAATIDAQNTNIMLSLGFRL